MYNQAKLTAILPNNWEPRLDQLPLWTYLERGGLRADVVAHRRWGKDDVMLHWGATAAHKRIGTYWHMLPEAAQARKAIWDAINPRTGKRRIDEAFPPYLRATTREDQMFIKLKCGSTWQVVGSDNYNSLVGSPPIGVTLSEWALAKPGAWQYLRPILLENGGWACFIWTPRGRNHATRAFEARAKDALWYTQRLSAEVTPVFTAAQLASELQELIDETGSIEEGTAIYNTEYLVDFDAPIPGAYYGSAIRDAQTANRITKILYNSLYPVSTSWDLGVDDYTAIWFFQRILRDRIHVIGFYESGDIGSDQIFAEAIRPKLKAGWRFDYHYLPHDVKVREWGGAGASRKQTLYKLGVRPIRVGIPRDEDDRVNAVRKLLPYCHFDEVACHTGIDHLKQFSKSWNRSLGLFTGPLKNEHKHAADGFGEFAVNAKLPDRKKEPVETEPNDSYHKKRSIIGNIINWKVA